MIQNRNRAWSVEAASVDGVIEEAPGEAMDEVVKDVEGDKEVEPLESEVPEPDVAELVDVDVAIVLVKVSEPVADEVVVREKDSDGELQDTIGISYEAEISPSVLTELVWLLDVSDEKRTQSDLAMHILWYRIKQMHEEATWHTSRAI